MKLLIIDNYDSFVYNIVQYVGEMGIEPEIRKNDNLESLANTQFDKIIISPGPGTPENMKDRGEILDFIRCQKNAKVLGVCFGHQLLGLISGSTIYRMDKQLHGELDTMQHFDSPLYDGIPQEFRAVRYHSLAVEGNGNLVVDCRSKSDGSVMGFHTEDKKFFGIQYHPESFYSEFGKEILTNFMVMK